MIFKVDIDDVVCDLMTQWLNVYNLRWSDKLEKKFITDWAIHEFTLPMCGKNIYSYLTPQLYEKVQPIKGALEGVRKLRNYGRVVFVTSFIPTIAGVKYKWLCDHGFIDNKKDYVETESKELISGDYMIDDGYHNLHNGCINILYNQPWNMKYEYSFRANNWEEVIKTVEYFEN